MPWAQEKCSPEVCLPSPHYLLIISHTYLSVCTIQPLWLWAPGRLYTLQGLKTIKDFLFILHF